MINAKPLAEHLYEKVENAKVWNGRVLNVILLSSFSLSRKEIEINAIAFRFGVSPL